MPRISAGRLTKRTLGRCRLRQRTPATGASCPRAIREKLLSFGSSLASTMCSRVETSPGSAAGRLHPKRRGRCSGLAEGVTRDPAAQRFPPGAPLGEADGRRATEIDRSDELAEWNAEDNPDGAQVLDELLAVLTKYVVLPDRHATAAVTLWIAATHALPAFDCAPRLIANSPDKRCGKTRLLDIIGGTCHQPLATVIRHSRGNLPVNRE